ncbi:O-antigen ligase family protein [Stutzerimonas stutzeri]|uniref:O-antigen ligase family protein n=1 Tax=Stutzerimonas stutzeri TaxID=316 RepID=UPI001BCECADE|nr:O-antigen ligase family protein [Stutzerimonas stutzeri]
MPFIAPQKAAYLGGFLIALSFYSLTISPPLSNASVYDSQRIVELVSLTLLCTLFPAASWPRRIKGLAATLFFSAGLISVIMAKNPFWALIEYLRILLLFLLAFSIATMQHFARTIILHTVIFMAFIATVKVIIGIHVTSQLGGGIAAIAANFSNHRHFAEFFIAIEGLLAFFILNNNGKTKFSLLAAIPLTTASIVVLIGASRASGLALLSSAAVFILLSEKYKPRSSAIIIASGLTGWLVTSLLIATSPLEQTIIRQGDSGRLHLWSAAIDSWLIVPFFGLGPMHFSAIPNDIAAHPHNAALQILCEWGLIALCAIALFFASWWHSIFSLRLVKKKINPPAAAALAGLVISSMFGGVLVIPAVELLFFILLGLTIAPEATDWRPVASLATIARTLSLMLCVLCIATWPWRNIDVARGAPIDAPRFWQNGGLPQVYWKDAP